MRVGVDVGGTHTDAVLVESGAVRASVKRPTTDDVTEGIRDAVASVLDGSGTAPDAIEAVLVGTTHFTNAVVERRGLERVAALRIGLPSGAALPPFVGWPADLAAVVRGAVHMIEGGHDYDGRAFVPFDVDGVRAAAHALAEHEVRAVAITALFSPLTPECEETAAALVREVAPHARVTCSHELGRIGLLGRENAAILNAALTGVAERTTEALAEAFATLGIDAPLWLTQNDGTVVRAEVARAFPVSCLASGPTNSMRGAAHLSGVADAIVVDVGGTTTDVGHLAAGFPRPASDVVWVGGVRTLFRMPDLLSVALGGGSVVDLDARSVGPHSVGHRLSEQALVFGGATPTLTDCAVRAGVVEIGGAAGAAKIPRATAETILERAADTVADAVDRVRIDAHPLPLIAVGGGAFLVPPSLAGVAEVLRVPHPDVANAVGAAIAQVSGEVDRIFRGVSRPVALRTAEDAARARAREAGAAPATVQVVEVEDLPLSYLPGDARRVRVRVVGDAEPARDRA